jgi:hypothetical protein
VFGKKDKPIIATTKVARKIDDGAFRFSMIMVVGD